MHGKKTLFCIGGVQKTPIFIPVDIMEDVVKLVLRELPWI